MLIDAVKKRSVDVINPDSDYEALSKSTASEEVLRVNNSSIPTGNYKFIGREKEMKNAIAILTSSSFAKRTRSY